MATKIALVGATCEASGHPGSCTEPAPGSVQSTSATSVTVGGTEVYTKSTADMHFGSHAHKYSDKDGDGSKECHKKQSHDLDPNETHSVTVNGDPVYLVGDSTSDPTSGGTAEIKDAGGNNSVTIS